MTASAGDPGPCVICPRGERWWGAGLDAGRRRQGSQAFSLYVNGPAGWQALPCLRGRWPLRSPDPLPASTPRTRSPGPAPASPCTSTCPSRAGKNDLVLPLPTWRQGRLGPGFCGPGRGPPCPVSPGGQDGRPGQSGGLAGSSPQPPAGRARPAGCRTSRGLRNQGRPAARCHHTATQEAGPPSLPQREEQLKEVKGPGVQSLTMASSPHPRWPGPPGGQRHTHYTGTCGARTGRHSARLEPPG